MENGKGQFKNTFGFLMAAVGSAVGLGNIWGFPYKMGNGGGFAFLAIYIVLAILIGYVIMLGELTLGRNSGKGIILTYKELSNKFTILGVMGFLSPYLILSFYSMLGGYCLKYSLSNLVAIFNRNAVIMTSDPGEYFVSFFSNPMMSTVFTLIFVAATAIIVAGGVSKGIEKFSVIAMPLLFVLLIVLIVRAVTLDGGVQGLEFMFKPNWEAFKGTGWISVFASAGGQMFFSLSLGMGIMITYGSYIPKEQPIAKNATTIIFFDTVIAIMAGMIVMPAVFAFGMEPAAGPSLLYISLQNVFQSMGAWGPLFGFLFFFLVFIAAITSSISLLEVLTSSVIDARVAKNKSADRKKATIGVTVAVALLAAFVSLDGLGTANMPHIFGQGTWLDTFDLLSEGLMMPLSALLMSLIIGWHLKDSFLEKELTLHGNKFPARKFTMACFKVIAPVGMLFVLLGQISNFFGLGWF